ncbi:MAG: hypothetical protein AABX59_02230, partial [Nanoarchaeota archaeon]
DGIVRGIERVATEVYNWELQMMITKYKKEHFEKVLGKKNGEKLYEELKEANKKGIKITVKPGSTLPTDKLSQRTEAIELAKANKISDIDFFERMDFANPREMAKKLWLQANKPELLYPDLMEDIKKEEEKNPPEPEVPAVIPGQEMPIPGQETPDMSLMPQIAQGMEGQQPVAPAMPQTPQVGTEHTQQLMQGVAVAPFEGIDPSQYQAHLSAELQFMGSDEFAQLPPEVQSIYAKHVLEERSQLQQPAAELEAQPAVI